MVRPTISPEPYAVPGLRKPGATPPASPGVNRAGTTRMECKHAGRGLHFNINHGKRGMNIITQKYHSERGQIVIPMFIFLALCSFVLFIAPIAYAILGDWIPDWVWWVAPLALVAFLATCFLLSAFAVRRSAELCGRQDGWDGWVEGDE